MIELPKNPKLTDLVEAITALEALVARNEARITTLEYDTIGPQGEQLDQLQADAARMRWTQKFRRAR